MQPEQTKLCPACRRELPADNFYAYTRTGRPEGYCRECCTAKNREYRRSRGDNSVAGPGYITLKEAKRIYREMTGGTISVGSLAEKAHTFRRWAAFQADKGRSKLVGVKEREFRYFVQCRKDLEGPETKDIFHTREDSLGFVR